MNKVEILQQARKEIKNGGEIYVCLAVEFPGGACHAGDTILRTQLKKWIGTLLGSDLRTLDDWLIAQHKTTLEMQDYRDYPEKMRVTRVAWIDWMIEYWTAKPPLGDTAKFRRALETAGFSHSGQIFNDKHKDGSRRLKYWQANHIVCAGDQQHNNLHEALIGEFGDRLGDCKIVGFNDWRVWRDLAFAVNLKY